MENLDLDEMKVQAYEKLYNEILSQESLCQTQESDILIAIVGNKDEVWIVKSSGSKMRFTINQATQGLTTIVSNIVIKKRLFKRLSGSDFNDYHEIKQKKNY